MNKKIASEIAIGVIVLIAIVIGGIFWWQNGNNIQRVVSRNQQTIDNKQQMAENNQQLTNTDQQQTVGGDKNVHGCIGSAGYSWCEEKQKCLKNWEEECEKIYHREDFKDGWSVSPDYAKRKEGIIRESDGTTFSVWRNRIHMHISSGVDPKIIDRIFNKIYELGGEVIGGDYDLQYLIIKTGDEVKFKEEIKKSNLPVIVTYDLVLTFDI